MEEGHPVADCYTARKDSSNNKDLCHVSLLRGCSPFKYSTTPSLEDYIETAVMLEYPFRLSSRDGTSERRDTVFLRSPFTSGPSARLATSMATA